MQPSPSTPISPSVPVVYPQSNAQTEVELVSPDALGDTETIATKMLEAQVCVTLAIPAGIFLLFYALYLFIFEFYLNNAVDMSIFEAGIFFLLASLVVLAGGLRYGKEGVSLHVSPSGVFIRTLKYGFFSEKVIKVNPEMVVGIEDQDGITLFYSSVSGDMIRIEAGLNEKRHEEIMEKIRTAIQ